MARILVVDDESLIRVLVADVGESLGHEVLTAASIKEGQDLAQRGVDMIVTEMGVMDVTPEGIVLREYNPEFTVEQIQAATEAKLIISPDLKPMA